MAMGWESIDGGRRVGEMGGTTPLGQPGKGRDISHLIPLPGPTKPHSQVDGSPIKHPPRAVQLGVPMEPTCSDWRLWGLGEACLLEKQVVAVINS